MSTEPKTIPGTADEHLLLGEMVENFPRCGCGDPASVFTAVRETLEAIQSRAMRASGPGYDGTIAAIAECTADGPAFWLWLYVIDDAGLTEHGTGIRGSWLTDKGKAILAAMQSCGTDPDAWAYHAASNFDGTGRTLVVNSCGADEFDHIRFTPTDAQWERARAIFGGDKS